MSADYEVTNGTLKVYAEELHQDYDISFDRACRDLIDSQRSELVIDLSLVKQLTSTYIGIMAATYFQIKNAGKALSIIATGRVLRILQYAGFENFITLVDPHGIHIPIPERREEISVS